MYHLKFAELMIESVNLKNPLRLPFPGKAQHVEIRQIM